MFGRTDLRISLSGAKFDEEADFDVRSAVGPPTAHQIVENLIFRSENFADFFFSSLKNENIGNGPKRVFANLRADRSQV